MGSLSRRISECVFYGIADTGYVAREDMFSKCEQMADAGAKIIQLRAKRRIPQRAATSLSTCFRSLKSAPTCSL